MWYANEKKKLRRSRNDAIAYLKQKSTKDHDLKEKELDLRKTELQSLLQIDKLKLQNNNNHDESFIYESNAGTGAATKSLQVMPMTQQQQENKILMPLIENKKA